MTEAAPTRLPVRLLVAMALSSALAPLNSTMVAVALPEMSRTLGAGSAELRQALVTSYLLTNIVFQSPGGKLGDRLGHRRALGLGQLLLALGAALAYLWPVLSVLTLSRIVMAVGGAIMVPSAMALLRTELPPEVRGRAFGMFGAVMGVSAGLGPTIGAQLVSRFGWTSIFLANVPVLLVSALLAHGGHLLGSSASVRAAPLRAPRFDLLGSFLLGISLVCIVLGLEHASLRWAIAVGALGFVPFALWERRVADPVVDFSLFRRRAFAGGSLLIALQNFALYSLIFELPQVGGRLFHLGPRDIGNTLMAMMGTMVVISPIAGRAADRFGSRIVALIGSVVALLGMCMLLFRPLTSMRDAIPALVLLGIGIGGCSAPAQSAAMGDVPREKSGMAAGVTSTMRYMGGILGVTLLGLVLSDRQEAEVVRQEHSHALSLFCAAVAVSIVCTLLLPRKAS